ncbi:MAG TPA: acyltransferase [Acidimicrobiales bacterium]|nr:acyltransferase [Acidimicrobiales bacterium]
MGASDHATGQATGHTTLLDEAPAELPTTTTVAPVGGPRRGPSRLGHRPALDGVRGLAIVAVLLYHVGQTIWPGAHDWLAPGGFVGVDLFFALSGFLITSLLLEEAQRLRRIDLGGFLERRAVRLLPALAVALGVIFVAALFGHGENTPQELLSRSLWNLAFLQNWDIPNRLVSELGHTWSLAVEGQFYVLWSVTATLVVALTRKNLHRTPYVLLALAGLTAAVIGVTRALRFGDTNAYALYLSTTTRLDGPLIGSIAGIAYSSGWLDRLSRRGATVLAAGGLLVLGYCAQNIGPFEGFLYHGGFTLYALVGSTVVASAATLTDGGLLRFLSRRPLVFLGTISYSLFLWHIPVFLTLQRSAADWSSAARVLVGVPLAFALAWLSYALVERPLLRRSRQARERRRTRAAARAATNGDGNGADTAPRIPAGDVVGLDGLRRSDRRRLRRAWALAATPVLLLYTWVLTAGSWNLFQRQYFDDFFDAQGRSLLAGRWDVPPEVVGFEGFLINGRMYIYFGPFPALLRMPLLAMTDRLDGRLTTLSMLAAMLVLAWTSFRLITAVRAFVRGEAPVTRVEVIGTALLSVAVLSGTPFWLGSETAVYHEAALWAVALTIATFDAIARWMLDPRTSRLVLVSGLIAATLITRQTLGLGVLVTMAVVGLCVLLDRVRARRDRRPERIFPGTKVWVLLLSGLVPLAISIAPNYARFEKPFGVPVDRHVYTLEVDDRRDFLDANGGKFFGPQFLATNLLQYFRPDAFDIRPDLPWIDYPRSGPKVLGDVTYDGVSWSSSIPVTMPVLFALALLGAFMLLRAVRQKRPENWLAVLWAGAIVGAGGVATIGYVAHRYLDDFFPGILLPAYVGFHVLVRRILIWRGEHEFSPILAPADDPAGDDPAEDSDVDEAREPVRAPMSRRTRRRLRTGIAVGLAMLAFGVFANTALALEYQRERGPAVPEWRRSAWVKARATLPFSKEPARVPMRWPLPDETWDGRLAVVGDCDALYVRVGEQWLGVERGPSVGVYDLQVDLDALDSLAEGQRAPLLTLGGGFDATVVAATRTTDDRVRLDVWSGAERGWDTWFPQKLDGVVTLRVESDRYQLPNQISYQGRTVYAGAVPRPDAFVQVGQGPDIPGLAESYPGDISLVPDDRSICHAVAD